MALLLLNLLIILILTRSIFIYLIRYDLNLNLSRISFIKLLVTPRTLPVKKNSFIKFLNLRYILTSLFSIPLAIFTTIFILNEGVFQSVIFTYLVTLLLIILSVNDLIYFEISASITRVLVMLAILFNILGALTNLLDFKTFALGTLDNLITGVVFSIIFYLIVRLTKEKGMGEGDIFLFMFIGLIFGWKLGLISITLTLLYASLFGLTLAILKRKFKNILIPLVPFISLGFITTLALGKEISLFLFPFL